MGGGGAGPGGAYGILGDLNSFGGAADYLNVSRSSKKWVTAALLLCLAQIAVGVVMFLMDSWMVYDLSAKFLGQLVAGAMIAIGGVGSLGASKRSRALLNLHIVGVIIAVMLGVQYITAFSRDNYVNCAMARLFVRVRPLPPAQLSTAIKQISPRERTSATLATSSHNAGLYPERTTTVISP
jgi:peptidoglycan/LPS O-acetylase OafA/YrhL